ncbi:hypothetical protein MTO96_016671 [Rhipicephalus appendiculatus]
MGENVDVALVDVRDATPPDQQPDRGSQGSADFVPRPSAVAPSRLSFERSVLSDSWQMRAGRPLTRRMAAS